MNLTVLPGTLKGAVTAPPSKSHVHRLLIAAALCEGETMIHCPGENEDIAATARCLESCGARMRRIGESFTVSGPLQATIKELDCGESGSTLRFLLPLCACLPGEAHLIGRGRLPGRPNAPLLEALREHGAEIESDFLPLTVGGPLHPGAYALPGNVSSQYFTGLLFALPLLNGDSTLIYTSPLESMPYVDLTLSVLAQFGIRVEPIENCWRVPGNQRFVSPGSVEAEGDWSAAAFWLGANQLGNEITVNGLNPASCQGDKAVKALLDKISGEIDVTDTPDLMPILAAVAAAAPNRTTRITGAARLRLKESDRLTAMANAIKSLGGNVEEQPDGLTVHGTQLQGGTVDGVNDHRVVMSAAIAATACREPVTIRTAEAVEKSYPHFWNDFEALGGKIIE